MKQILLTFVSLLILVSCTPAPGRRVIARVEGEKIRVNEFKIALDREAIHYEPALLAQEEGLKILKNRVLNDLIGEKLIIREAALNGVSVPLEDLIATLERLQSGYEHREFDEHLQKKGLTREGWEARQETKLLTQKWTEHLLEGKGPTEAEIKREFTKFRSRYREPERSHCRQIVTSSEEKAEKILSLIKKGENFAAIAQEHSESPDRKKGGDLGFVERGELPPIMDDACFRFKPGQTSGVVKSAYGFHVFRVIEKKKPKRLSLSEARPLILDEWRAKNRDEILKVWLEERVKEAHIEIDEKIMNQTTLSL